MRDDMVSRQVVIEMIKDWNLNQHIINEEDAIDDVNALPSIEPEQKTGKWIATYSDSDGDVWVSWKCSNCGYVRKKGWKYTDDGKKPDALFCEMCNADMRGEQDD